MQSERLRPPWSAGRSPSRGTRGASEQEKDPGPLCSRRSHSRSPPNRKNPITNSTSSSAAAPSARGRPRRSMAACGGAQGGAHPQAAGSISRPTDPGRREEGQPWAAGPDSCLVPTNAELTPHLLQRLGDPDLTFPEAGQGAGKGGGGAGLASPSRSQLRPQPGFRFHLRLAEPEGRGDPPGGLTPPLPRHPTASPQAREEPRKPPGKLEEAAWEKTATQEGPGPATCCEPIRLFAALGPHCLPLTSLRERGRDPGPGMKGTARVRGRGLE